MSEALPLVTVLIPARNEEADIERCLRAVLAQDYPHDRMEIVLVDGDSEDATVDVARQVLDLSDVSWTAVENPAGKTPISLNVGLAAARGEFICRVDARSIIPAEYVRSCVEILERRGDVTVTGGSQRALARNQSARAQSIARALNNRYALGGSRYRSRSSSGSTDTVYLGAFRTADLRRVGGWDEYFWTNQDFEINRRLGRDGVVWFDDRLAVGYVPRGSLAELWQQYHRFGRWKVRYWRRTGDRPRARQIAAFVGLPCTGALFVAVLLGATSRDRRFVLIAAALAPLLVDALGSDGRAGPVVRARSAVTVADVTSAWVFGVYRELWVGPAQQRDESFDDPSFEVGDCRAR